MSQLVPCSGCGRHVRLSDSSCPFCDVALDVSALDERYAPRRNGVSSGMKRAALFAIGAGMAAACGGEQDDGKPEPDPSVQPVYGAPITDTTEQSSSDSESSADPGPTAQPLYGAPVTPDDTNGNTQPLYGAPIPDDTTDVATQPVYGAPVTEDIDSTAEMDAGAMDAGTAPTSDAGEVTSDDAGTSLDTEPVVVPLYGAPPLTQ